MPISSGTDELIHCASASATSANSFFSSLAVHDRIIATPQDTGQLGLDLLHLAFHTRWARLLAFFLVWEKAHMSNDANHISNPKDR